MTAWLRAWWSLPLLCKFGLHFGEWRPHLNFHSHHGVEVWRCRRCLQIRSRVMPRLPARKSSPR